MTLQLLHGDCLELMKTLPDKSIDLFVCDLPYGCLTGGAGKEKAKRLNAKGEIRTNHAGGVMGCSWDIPIDLNEFWVQVKRLCKDDHTPVLMFCTAKFGYELIKSNEAWFRYDLVWNKMRGVSFLSANKMPMRSHELIYVFSKKGATYYRKDREGQFKGTEKTRTDIGESNVYGGKAVHSAPTSKTTRCVLSVVDTPSIATRGHHPTQKPDDLYEWLITRYSKEGDTVLDPTAGSFASVFTAHRLGRKAIGIEKDDAFYDKATKRN
jgi:site-specific DNA-methyltransferase (adenine-specific)